MTSKGSLAVFADVDEEVQVEQLREQYVRDGVDLIIAEGWKSGGYPKVVVVRDHIGEVEVSPEGLLALVSNKPLERAPDGVPVLHPDDIAGLACIVGKRFPLGRGPRV